MSKTQLIRDLEQAITALQGERLIAQAMIELTPERHTRLHEKLREFCSDIAHEIQLARCDLAKLKAPFNLSGE